MAAASALNPLQRALRDSTALLRGARCRFALVGGLAVSARAVPRFTQDVDLVVAAQDEKEAATAVHHLVRSGFAVAAVLERESDGTLATVRLHSPPANSVPVFVDLMFRSCGIERETVDAAESLEVFDDLSMPVARLAHLLAMKVLSVEIPRRAKDADDLQRLVAAARPEDFVEARRLLGLIASRGFARGKDLQAEAARWLPGGT